MKNFDGISFGREGLAPYACAADESRGRYYDEPESPTRTPFQRDRDRIIHSTAFRRLKHKTQVFVYHVGDHYRTRLTHSIEVSQIARSLARAFGVDEDLAEALALCHDFGHTPFGHAGEDTLDVLMQDWGGFDHNEQSLKIVTELEQQYAQFDGLNLCWETLEGLVKHNGPLKGSGIPLAITNFNEKFDLELATHSSLEAQCAAIADDIAYNAHDIDDGLRAGLFSLEDVKELPISKERIEDVERDYPKLEARRLHHEIVRNQITKMVEDAIATTVVRLGTLKPKSAADIRNSDFPFATFSKEMSGHEKIIKAFLYERMYRAPVVMKMRKAAESILSDLFTAYRRDIERAPPSLLERLQNNTDAHKERTIADFLSSMTDGYAISEHRRLFDHTPELS
ncbi:MAG: deoxyguanosinetriphosphate triphosphohydrolase [Pseudomonadota bacterium]